MPKRRRPWGSITTVSRGKQIVRWVENTPQGRVRKSKTLACTYREADRWLAERRVKCEEPAVMTVGDLWEAYELPELEDRVAEGSLSPQTLRQYRSSWNKHVSPRWSSVPCTKVRALDIQDWMLTLTTSCALTARKVLKNVLAKAEMLDVIGSNPADRKFRLQKQECKARDIYTYDELRSIADAVKGTECEVPFLLSAFAGLRVGEACGVPVSCVSFKKDCAVIDVRLQLTSKEITDRLKTRNARRTAIIGEPWSLRLRDVLHGLPDRAEWTNDDGTGSPCPRWSVSRAWDDALSKSGIRRLSMRALRPSYETWMHWDAGVPLDKLAKLMGHASSRTTEGIYDRPSDSNLTEEALRAASAVAEKYPKQHSI